MIMAGFVALTAWLASADPVMTPLMPVLASPWLAVHVSLVITAYALLGSTMPLSLISLLCADRSKEMASLCEGILMPGVYILGLGIFTGAMWANVSWGRYWGWDSKETWALVTMLVYALPLHRSVGLRRDSSLLSIYLLLAFSSIIMTYAGVNMLPSKHAYI